MSGHLDRLTRRTDSAKVAECAPVFAPIVSAMITCIDWMMRAKGRNGVEVRINEAGRSPERQLERFRQGRVLKNGVWIIADPAQVVTNAAPEDAPHCVLDENKAPASMAVDLWLLDSDTGELLHDKHAGWAMVPAAAYLCGGPLIRVGAHFNRPRDWPHVEVAGWRSLIVDGVFKESHASSTC